MHSRILTLLALCLATTPLAATESGPTDPFVPEVVPSAETQAAPDVDVALQLVEVSVEQRAAAGDAATTQLGQPGSFWWVVGAIVVAGVILAVLL